MCGQLQKKGLEILTRYSFCFSANQNAYTVTLPHAVRSVCARTHLLCMRKMVHHMIGGLALVILLSKLCKCTSFACGNHYKYNFVLNTTTLICIVSLLFLFPPAQNEDAVQKIPLSVVKPGDNVTLTCQIPYVTGVYFYKLKFGYLGQAVAVGYDKVLLQGQFNTSRFTATKEDFLYRFVIRNVSKEDEATYLCQAGSAYKMSFTNGTVLIVDGNVRPYLGLFW